MNNTDIYQKVIRPYLTGEKTTCSYCDRLDPLIIYYGDYFYITCVIGAYMPGYIQLCSYEHRTSITGIQPDEYEEFEKLVKAIRTCFKKVYGNYGICFEHGQAGSCMWTENHINSLCHHMHVHCLPVEINIHEEIIAHFRDFNEVHSIKDMVKIRKDKLKGGPYLYFSPSPDKGYMYNVTNQEVPRQFLRRCVAERIGILEKADWINYPGIEYYNDTINDLKNILIEEIDHE